MESRRLLAVATLSARQSGPIPSLLRSGAGLLFGAGPRGATTGWVSSVIWSIAAPALIAFARRSGDTLVQKLIHSLFPGSSKKPVQD